MSDKQIGIRPYEWKHKRYDTRVKRWQEQSIWNKETHNL